MFRYVALTHEPDQLIVEIMSDIGVTIDDVQLLTRIIYEIKQLRSAGFNRIQKGPGLRRYGRHRPVNQFATFVVH